MYLQTGIYFAPSPSKNQLLKRPNTLHHQRPTPFSASKFNCDLSRLASNTKILVFIFPYFWAFWGKAAASAPQCMGGHTPHTYTQLQPPTPGKCHYSQGRRKPRHLQASELFRQSDLPHEQMSRISDLHRVPPWHVTHVSPIHLPGSNGKLGSTSEYLLVTFPRHNRTKPSCFFCAFSLIPTTR